MVRNLYEYRFEVFLTTQIVILFGSLLVPNDFFEYTLLPFFYLVSIAAGILLISKNKKVMWFFIVLFTIAAFFFGFDMISRTDNIENLLIRLSIYFLFHIIVTWHIILQVWREKTVDKKVILGLMSGYISLGFLAFFLFMSIDLTHSGAFTGSLLEDPNSKLRFDSILYYAYITLLTVGYGEIVPAIPIAQKAAILVGLIGQFYIVIITGIVVGKYINQTQNNS